MSEEQQDKAVEEKQLPPNAKTSAAVSKLSRPLKRLLWELAVWRLVFALARFDVSAAIWSLIASAFLVSELEVSLRLLTVQVLAEKAKKNWRNSEDNCLFPAC